MGFSSRAQRRGFEGVTKLRKTLRRLEPEATQELKNVTIEAGEMLKFLVLGNVQANGLIWTGDMAQWVDSKLSGDKLTVVVGVGAGNAHIRKNGFAGVTAKYTASGNLTKATVRNRDARWAMYKALWAEFGTKGASFSYNGRAVTIPPQPATNFHQKAFDQAAPRIRQQAGLALKNILRDAVNG